MAHALNVTDGQAGNVITAYAMAIVIGGPVLTLWLARFEKRNVLAGLMVLFIAANLVSALSTSYWLFMVATFLFGIASFGNVPPLQMNVMKHGSAATELAGTANISAFNLANALGGIIGGLTVDSTFGAAGIPWVATLIVSRSVIGDFEPPLLAELKALSPGNDAISELDYLICRENKTPRQAVESWYQGVSLDIENYCTLRFIFDQPIINGALVPQLRKAAVSQIQNPVCRGYGFRAMGYQQDRKPQLT